MTIILKSHLAMLGTLVLSFSFANGQDTAQQPIHQHTLVFTSPHKSMLPGSVDGSKNPELIPDSTAYRIFFRALTADADKARQTAMLGRANLSPADLEIAMAIGPEFEALRSAHRQHEQTAIAAASSNGGAFDASALEAEKAAIGLKMKSLMRTRLSEKGMASLDALIQSEKHNMTIFILPDMSGAK